MSTNWRVEKMRSAAVKYHPTTKRNRLLSLGCPCSVKGARHKMCILHECICLKRPEKAAMQGQKAAGAGGAGSGHDPHRIGGVPEAAGAPRVAKLTDECSAGRWA